MGEEDREYPVTNCSIPSSSCSEVSGGIDVSLDTDYRDGLHALKFATPLANEQVPLIPSFFPVLGNSN